MSTLLSCEHLCKQYGKKTALNDLNLTLDSGKIIGLLGPNGSGKTTFIKLINGLLTPNSGEILVAGQKIGIATKKIVSYLPERTYLNMTQRISDIMKTFEDFYEDFQPEVAFNMLKSLNVDPTAQIKSLSKGTREKVQLILVMSRKTKLYILDEPIAGVDPAARDYILNTILSNYNPDASILLSTHLISDIENILEDVIFIKDGGVLLHENADILREARGDSIDGIFRKEFSCLQN